MRLLFPVAILLTSIGSPAATFAPPTPGRAASPIAGNECPEADRHLTDWRTRPLVPRKLGELPPAETLAAVVRTDERGCLVPVKYPDVPRR